MALKPLLPSLRDDAGSHPDAANLEITANGDSVGPWEGDTLVVDTVGFSDKGITSIPGRGIRTPDSHFVERYRLMDSGERLLATFTWTDPKVFANPTLMFFCAIAPHRDTARWILSATPATKIVRIFSKIHRTSKPHKRTRFVLDSTAAANDTSGI